ncbi:hypothetical protein K2173_018887 [Erythroxylum novogranatense]|uniref:Protein TPX2 n=1 Tax=Erythroxylum novogranatense TaxID=1862640 RepID=A0AAV8SB42_9ROSI|nr:hypothetical protein K2173_018887 [Erythroxylum novogranatense]
MAENERCTLEKATVAIMIDDMYEFQAPRFFDFIKAESEEDVRNAELWFDNSLSYAPSPFMPKIKTGRSFKVESLCDFSEAEPILKVAEISHSTATNCSSENRSQSEVLITTVKKEETTPEEISVGEGKFVENKETVCNESDARTASLVKQPEQESDKDKGRTESCCTPKPPVSSNNGSLVTCSKKQQSSKPISNLARNKSAKSQSQSSIARGMKPASAKKSNNVKSIAGTPSLAQENQAIKRQKLEGGKSKQILNFKPPQQLIHKSKLGLASMSSSTYSNVANNMSKEERKIYVREKAAAAPFISTAEMIKKFQSSTRDLSIPNVNGSISQNKLALTRPKEPELETTQRVRPVRVKSTVELEEEMMAKIPKFKARPLNKKILDGPTLPSVSRSKPQPPEFQEFHFQTTARANQNIETSSVASTEASHQNSCWKPQSLTEPKTPVLHTSLRARPPRVKSSFEVEEELAKMPKFKARPLNKKIFESKGELGIFYNAKKHVTIPQEFHFATDDRIPPAASVADLFDKLSLKSEPQHTNPIPRNTVPNPFSLYTEERGAEKERRLLMDLMEKLVEEESVRIPKAHPYPYTTDYPVIPPKPVPKPCTKPEPFQLESLVRHEEEMQRETEERQRLEKQEFQMRIFKAQPILKEDPIPVPEKARKPLTQVQQFNLHVDHRAVDRAEFDQKVKEKEVLYKRYREESEAAKMIEEEKALKQLRRTMVPHARPVPNFNKPFLPLKSSKEATKAKSPNLEVLRRKSRRNMTMKAVSSPASSMR